MQFAKLSRVLTLGLALGTLMYGCGSGSTTAPASIRVVNLIGLNANSSNSSSDAVTLTLNSTAYTMTAAPQAGSGYASVTPGTYGGGLETYNDPSISSSSFPLGLATNQTYTVLAYPRATSTGGKALYPFELVDNMPTPAAGQINFSIANASPDAGAVDVYLIQRASGTAAPADACAGTLPGVTFPSVQPSTYQQSAYLPFNVNDSTGNAYGFDVCVTAAGNTATQLLSLTSLAMTQGNSYVLALTSSQGGVLVNAALVPQTNPTTITLLQNNQMRFRVLAAMSGADASSTVNVSVSAGTASSSLNGLTPGNYSNYVAVLPSANATSATVTVTGTSTTAPSPQTFTFTPGGDYTILVYDTAAGTSAFTVLTDDNHSDASKARVRLINGVDTAAAGVSAYFGGLVGPSDVLLGGATVSSSSE